MHSITLKDIKECDDLKTLQELSTKLHEIKTTDRVYQAGLDMYKREVIKRTLFILDNQ